MGWMWLECIWMITVATLLDRSHRTIEYGGTDCVGHPPIPLPCLPERF